MQMRTSSRRCRSQETAIASGVSPGLMRMKALSISAGDPVSREVAWLKAGGMVTRERALRVRSKYPSGESPVHRPCFCHSWRASRSLGMRSRMERTACGDGWLGPAWQCSG